MISLGPIETKFFAWLQLNQLEKVQTGDLVRDLKLSDRQEATLLSRIESKGLITRLQRGLYLVPKNLPIGGAWQADPLESIKALMEKYDATYQIAGLFALNFYGLSEQVPQNFFIYNDSISGERTCGSSILTFAKVEKRRLGSIDVIGNDKPYISSLPRTLFDVIYDWKRFGQFPRIFEWVRQSIADKKVLKEFVECTLKYGNTGTSRRVGFILESNGISESILKQIDKTVPPSSAYIPLNPLKTNTGSVSDRWGIRINDSIEFKYEVW